MADKNVKDILKEIKNKTELMEISILDWKGEIIEYTQDEEFVANGAYYSLIAGAVRMISKSYKQNTNGVTIQLDGREFFFHYPHPEGKDEKSIPIVVIEYEPGSISRSERFELVNKIYDDLNI